MTLPRQRPPYAPSRKREAVPTEPRWYIVHCLSGQEERVKKALEQRIEKMDLKHKVLEVVLPTEEVMEVREGKKVSKRERLFPGYLLVRMIMDDEAWFAVRHTPGITGFVSADDERGRPYPVPLTDQEVDALVKRMESGQPRPRVGFSPGQAVKITDGPFKDFLGTVDQVLLDKGKVKVLVSFFGRETPIELDFTQVERVA